MHPRTARNCCVLTLAAGLIAGCQGVLAPAPPPAPAQAPSGAVATTGRAAAFSADRAWQYLRSLTEIGPRPVRSEGNAKARAYITAELEKLKLEVASNDRDILGGDEVETETGEPASASESHADPDRPSFIVHNLWTKISGGDSEGSILLMAPFDTQAFEDFEFVGANDGGSGAAVLLELARVIAAEPLPYTTEIVFLDGQSPFEMPGKDVWLQRAGTQALAIRKGGEGAAGIRLAVYLNRICDSDLRIARDLLSHRIYREQFWKVAAQMGHKDAFPPDAQFESTGLAHGSLSKAGLRRVVSLVDTRFGGDEPPGLYAGTEEDTLERCSAESLGTVGSVTLGGLELISQWMIRIDRFTSVGQADPIDADAQAADTAPLDAE